MRVSDRKLPIGQQIKLLRLERGLGLKVVEARAQGRLNRSSLSRIENGGEPSLVTLEVLAPILSCEVRVEPGRTAYLLPLDS